ncbi:MAG: DUF4870 domain-containing protein [Anaerolineae bacterium]|nr:DUF4870 domain-containing protein [Anaerolineae bacterium]
MKEVEDRTGEKQPVLTRKLEPGANNAAPRPRRPETRKLNPADDPDLPGGGSISGTHLGLTRREMSWAAVAHGSILITLLLGLSSGGILAILGPIIPAIIWYAHRDESKYVTDQARQATIFQLAGIVALLALAIIGSLIVGVGWAVSAILVIVLIGLLLLPIMLVVTLLWVVGVVALPIVQVVYGCYATLEAYNGRPFRYWWIADMIDRYQTQA